LKRSGYPDLDKPPEQSFLEPVRGFLISSHFRLLVQWRELDYAALRCIAIWERRAILIVKILAVWVLVGSQLGEGNAVNAPNPTQQVTLVGETCASRQS
jgi:hypothetical protein